MRSGSAGAVAFALTFLLREIPLRQTTRSDGLGESFAYAGRQLVPGARAVAQRARGREKRWETYAQFAERAGIDLSPSELWLLARIAEQEPVGVNGFAPSSPSPEPVLADSLATLEALSLVLTDGGQLGLTTADETSGTRADYPHARSQRAPVGLGSPSATTRSRGSSTSSPTRTRARSRYPRAGST